MRGVIIMHRRPCLKDKGRRNANGHLANLQTKKGCIALRKRARHAAGKVGACDEKRHGMKRVHFRGDTSFPVIPLESMLRDIARAENNGGRDGEAR